MSVALVQITDAAEWDALADQRQGHLLQRWGWGKLKGRFGWSPLRLAARAADGSAALAQVLVRRQLGLSVWYVPRGPVWSGRPELDELLLRGLRRLARRDRAAFLRIEPNTLQSDRAADERHALLQLLNFEPADPMQPRTSIHLALKPTPDELQAAMSKGHRADIKRAAKKGVAVRAGSGEADFAAFYQLMEETAARAQFGIHSADYYRMALEQFGDAAQLLLAESEGTAVAAFLIFGAGAEGQYMYSASNGEGLKLGANHLLQWEALQWAKSRGCALYDFWGIPDALGEAALTADEAERERLEQAAKDHPLGGVYRFKKGFGGSVVRYLPAYDHVFIRPAYWLWKRRRAVHE